MHNDINNIKSERRYPRDTVPMINSDFSNNKYSDISGFIRKILSDSKDTDKLLIGLLILILLKENTDKKLLLALAYIML